MQQRQKSGQDLPTAYCQPSSLPAALLVLEFKMIQASRQIVVLPGNGDPARQIYIDGRSLPEDPEPSWMGSSVGRWQGETLVVDTTGFKESAWLDGFGHPRSEAMHITERYRRRDFGNMDLELTFDDPKYYTRPFGFKTALTLLPDTDVLEYVCMENQRRYRPPCTVTISHRMSSAPRTRSSTIRRSPITNFQRLEASSRPPIRPGSRHAHRSCVRRQLPHVLVHMGEPRRAHQGTEPSVCR